jgi:hypothetical protein
MMVSSGLCGKGVITQESAISDKQKTKLLQK